MKEIGSEFSLFNKSLDFRFRDFINNSENYRLFRSGRDGLKYIAKEYKIVANDNIVLIPSYSCESMYNPFFYYDWKIIFYKLNKNLEPDLEDLTWKLKKFTPHAVLVMDYFGVTNIEYAINLINSFSQDILVIEDVTHKIFDVKINNKVHFYIGSIRKWLGIVDGAFVLSYRDDCLPLPIVTYKETPFITLRKKALDLKFQYLYCGDKSIKDRFRTLLREAETYIDTDKNFFRISDITVDYLHTVNVNSIIYMRKKNYEALRNLLKNNPLINFLNEASDITAPFSLPILANNRDEIQKKLADRGIYAPLLWPLNTIMRQCENSARMERMMLSLPVDQRYDYSDMEYIALNINEIII